MPNKEYCPGCGRADTVRPYTVHLVTRCYTDLKCSHCGNLAGPVAMSQGRARNIAQMYDERGPFREKLREKREQDYDAEHGPGAWDSKEKLDMESMFPDSSALVDKAVAKVRGE